MMGGKEQSSRLKRLNEYLSEHELEGVIISKPENRRYFSGFTGSAGNLLIGGQVASLSTDFRYFEQAFLQSPDFTLIKRTSDADSVYQTLANEIHRLGWKKVGIEADYLTLKDYQRFADFIPQLEQVNLNELRAIKDEGELALIQNAVQLADSAFAHILKYLRPGVSERDIALELEFHMRKKGADKIGFESIIVSGARGALPHGLASDKKIEFGDFVTMDFGAVYQGYHSDITRTVLVGKASNRQREIYQCVKNAQMAGVTAIRAGKTGREVDAVARQVIQDAGYGEYFGHGLGHGLGLEIHEELRLATGSKDILTKNMVVTVEPGVYIPGWGGVRIEDTVVVTAVGASVLTGSSKELIELDW